MFFFRFLVTMAWEYEGHQMSYTEVMKTNNSVAKYRPLSSKD